MIIFSFIIFIFFYISFLFPSFDFKEKISDYNIYKGDPKKLITTSNFITYEIITPLFSDYSYKHRSISIPKNKKILYNDRDVLEFPIGTIIAKTFYYPNNFNDIKAGVNLKETRIMIHQENGWIGLPYIWNNSQTEAYLEISGGVKKASWIDIDGIQQSINYIIPNMNQCKGCHVNSGIFTPIGPTAAQLNMIYDDIENQLIKWKKMGILEGLSSDSQIPKMAKWDDSKTYSLNDRARAWLDINCAHCHNKKGPANNTGLHLDYYETNLKALGINKTPVAAGRGSGHLKYDIVPGNPDESILVYRFKSTDPGIMMPELGRTMVHKEGLELIREWILNLN